MFMPKKILFCATVDYHFQLFHLPQMKWFKEQGWEVHVAAAGHMELDYTDRKFHIPIARSPFRSSNIKAYKELKSIIKDNDYSMIHCHTPLGGVITRLAARYSRKKQKTKVLYTAHGFHFCQGAPLFNWMIYYPIERWLSFYTDALITINDEDYRLASSHKFMAQEIFHIHGVGVDTDRFKPIDETEKASRKKSLGYNLNDFLLFYGAEFNQNKNQQLLIKTMEIVKKKRVNVRLLLAGSGSTKACQELSKQLGVDKSIEFLGLRDDIDQLLPICDMAVGSSLREGLPVNIMEAMSCQLPIVATVNRGHSELISDDLNGWIVNANDPDSFANKIIALIDDDALRRKLGVEGRNIIEKKYQLNLILQEQKDIYSRYLEEEGAISWAVQ